MELTQSYLKSCLHYNPDLGCFFWRERPRGHFKNSGRWITWNKLRAGQLAGSISDQGYLKIRIRGKLLRGHRIAWLLSYGEWPTGEIDHINGVRDDNRISNLRVASRVENGKNLKLKKNSSSGVCGVSWVEPSKKWRAHIKVNYRQIHLGSFTEKSDAIAAREAANIKYGFHANHGGR